jgi:hypothetical protein
MAKEIQFHSFFNSSVKWFGFGFVFGFAGIGWLGLGWPLKEKNAHEFYSMDAKDT